MRIVIGLHLDVDDLSDHEKATGLQHDPKSNEVVTEWVVK
jgi:hypothetical protein